MAWRENCPMNEKLKFIAAWQTEEHSISELCRQFNISRKTGYKILARYEKESVDGLKPRSRAPHSSPTKIDKQTSKLLFTTKERFPKWGARKIKRWLEQEHPNEAWPAASTIWDMFKRNGLVNPRKTRAKAPPYTQPFLSCSEPNRVWSADFKGQFKLGTGRFCYPLTISDNYSRFLLSCKALYHPRGDIVMKNFEALFKEYGLPKAIRTDNGPPFASPGLGGLSRLSIWWLKLGIKPERIKPGCPEQNGRHERFHRTLKEATITPPYQNLQAQQRAFNRFMEEYNFERPHEGINGKRPGNIYRTSDKQYPTNLPNVEYAKSYEVRYVRSNGQIKWKGDLIYVSETLHGEPVGLKEIDNGIWGVYFARLKLGNINLKLGRVIL